MEQYGIEFSPFISPELDANFMPFELFIRAYLSTAGVPISIAIHRRGSQPSVYDTFVHGTKEMEQADLFYLERILKFFLWSRGGYRAVVYGAENLVNRLKGVFAKRGKLAFDCAFMERIYGEPFVLEGAPYTQNRSAGEQPKKMGGYFDGCRIGFDAGGSDRKVSAVIDGEPVFSEEVLWHPKETDDPEYHYGEIVSALQTAASHLPRVDAIGISSAGVFVDNLLKVSSLFIKVPDDKFDQMVQSVYVRAAKQIGDVPVQIANDGDVAALAGSLSLGVGNLMGIAMGTSEATGYVNKDRAVLGWLNELAFAPVDIAEDAPIDDWSRDRGCGSSYFSQDAVIRLAAFSGIELGKAASKAKNLQTVQTLAERSDERALKIFESVGCYLGHAAALYSRFYQIEHLLLIGRVTSGVGGELILKKAKEVLERDYPDRSGLRLHLPDEASRRVGQSVAAASLPKLKRKRGSS